MKGFNPLSALTAAVKELSAKLERVFSELKDIRSEQKKHTEMLEYLIAERSRLETKIDKNNELIHNLVDELSRFKVEGDHLLISIFAYCKSCDVRVSLQQMRDMGLKAKRKSLREGWQWTTVQDPRFGEVGLYDRQMLEELFPVVINEEE